MCRLVLLILTWSIFNTTCNATEPSYEYILEEARAARMADNAKGAQEALARFIALSPFLHDEQNIGCAVTAAETLHGRYDEKDGLTVLNGLMSSFFTQSDAVDSVAFLASSKYIVDSSIYERMATLYEKMNQPELSAMFKAKADAQRIAAWGNQLHTPTEKIDYAALGLPNPDVAAAPTEEEIEEAKRLVALAEGLGR